MGVTLKGDHENTTSLRGIIIIIIMITTITAEDNTQHGTSSNTVR